MFKYITIALFLLWLSLFSEANWIVINSLCPIPIISNWFLINDINCNYFKDQEDAQNCYNLQNRQYGDIYFLDWDNDWVACETLPSRYQNNVNNDAYITNWLINLYLDSLQSKPTANTSKQNLNTLNKSCSKKFPWTIYRSTDEMCICPKDWEGKSTRNKEINWCPLDREEFKKLENNCSYAKPWTIYDTKSKSCICENGNKWNDSSKCSAQEIYWAEKDKMDKQCDSKWKWTKYMSTKPDWIKLNKAQCLCPDWTPYHNARSMWCERCWEWTVWSYKTLKCENLDYVDFLKCWDKSLKLVHSICKENKSRNFTNWTKELNTEWCLIELGGKFKNKTDDVLRFTAWQWIPKLFSLSCEFRYYNEEKEISPKLIDVIKMNWKISSYDIDGNQSNDKYYSSYYWIMSTQLNHFNTHRWTTLSKNKSNSKINKYREYIFKELCINWWQEYAKNWYSFKQICQWWLNNEENLMKTKEKEKEDSLIIKNNTNNWALDCNYLWVIIPHNWELFLYDKLISSNCNKLSAICKNGILEWDAITNPNALFFSCRPN